MKNKEKSVKIRKFTESTPMSKLDHSHKGFQRKRFAIAVSEEK
jgi:hypothetical protein